MAVGLTDLDTFDADAELVVDLVRSARLASVCGLTRASRVHVGDRCSGLLDDVGHDRRSAV